MRCAPVVASGRMHVMKLGVPDQWTPPLLFGPFFLSGAAASIYPDGVAWQ